MTQPARGANLIWSARPILKGPAMSKFKKPQAFASETKDHRFAGSFEVLLPIPDRVKPLKLASQFKTQHEAETWIHSDEGQTAIEDALSASAKGKK
jgi:hypothetical protein